MTNENGAIDQQVRDVLAAEEFVVPAPDPALSPEKLELPPDPVGEEPHDVLAAEEFAMPAPNEARVPVHAGVRRRTPLVRLAAIGVPPLLLSAWLWRRVRPGGQG